MAETKEKKSMFSIDADVATKEEGFSSVQPGIHDNVILDSVSYEDASENPKAKYDECLTFAFKTTGKSFKKDAQGNAMKNGEANIVISQADQTIKYQEWYTKSKMEADPDKLTKMMSRITHILRKFKGEEVKVTGDTFKELSDNIIKLLEDREKGLKLRLKVIKSDAQYSNVPKYTPFIGRMSSKPNNLSMSAKEWGAEATSAGDLLDSDGGGDFEIPLT